MGTVAALLLATPIFGLSLQLEPEFTDASIGSATTVATSAVALDVADVDSEGDEEDSSDREAGERTPPNETAAQMQRRGRLAPIHRALGIATWASMTGTVLLGWFQYHNLYGFFSSRENTPCTDPERGVIFGPSACVRQPLPHLVSSLATTALYTATFGLSLAMHDPIGLDSGDSEYASNLRTHKILRWVHIGGMIAQMLLGIVIANANAFGLDRANDYGTLQALSTVHMGIGMVTWGAMTWAGLLFL